MSDQAERRFDRLLKAMVDGESPSGRKDSRTPQQARGDKPAEESK